jgi:hypothetical protein
MENNQEKMHSMISSVGSEVNLVNVYNKTTTKYNFNSIKTVKEAMGNQAPSLALMRKTNEELSKNLVKLMLAKTARAFNLTRNIEPAQIVELTELIMQDFYYFKLSEVFYVLKQAKYGKYGKTYERIDEPTILSWFIAHDEERTHIAVEKSMLDHDKYTHTEKGRQYDGIFEKAYSEAGKEQDRVKEMAMKLAKKIVYDANAYASEIPPQVKPSDDNQPRAQE